MLTAINKFIALKVIFCLHKCCSNSTKQQITKNKLKISIELLHFKSRLLLFARLCAATAVIFCRTQPKVGRITRLNNDEVWLICYENGLELDLGTSEWPNLLLYSCCKPMFWMHWNITFWVVVAHSNLNQI